MARTLGLTGLDVSKYQTSLPSLAGQSFIILRASIAQTKDTKFDEHYANARKAGLVVMAYHYAYPASAASIESQVALFLDVAKNCDFLWLDQEESGFDDAQAQQFIDLVRESGRPCGLYHSASGFGGVKADAQWVADYREASVAAGHPRNTATGAELAGWDLWQWTSKGSLPGYTGNLDLNWLNPASKLATLLRTGYVTRRQMENAVDAAVAETERDLQALLTAVTAQRDSVTAELAALQAAYDPIENELEAARATLAEQEQLRAAGRRLLGL